VSAFTADEITTIGADATVAEAAMAMTAGELGLLVVGSADDVEGVISERDVVRAVGGGRDLARSRSASWRRQG
jgi:CBS domain-containing protein